IVGIGVDPDVELARSGGLPCDNGIVVDERGRTADPLIVAAGDCTNHPHPLAASRVRLESVQNAIEQAKAAASNFAGEPHAYAEVPWFWSDQYDLKLQIAGLAEGYDETIVRGDPAQKSFAVYHLRGGELAAEEAVNAPRDLMFARKAIAACVPPRADQIADPAFVLAKLLPACAPPAKRARSAGAVRLQRIEHETQLRGHAAETLVSRERFDAVALDGAAFAVSELAGRADDERAPVRREPRRRDVVARPSKRAPEQRDRDERVLRDRPDVALAEHVHRPFARQRHEPYVVDDDAGRQELRSLRRHEHAARDRGRAVG